MYPKEQFTLYKVFMAATSIFVSDMGGGGVCDFQMDLGPILFELHIPYPLLGGGYKLHNT